jgi:hypothetical protein
MRDMHSIDKLIVEAKKTKLDVFLKSQTYYFLHVCLQDGIHQKKICGGSISMQHKKHTIGLRAVVICTVGKIILNLLTNHNTKEMSVN